MGKRHLTIFVIFIFVIGSVLIQLPKFSYAHEEVNIKIYSFVVGSTTYVLSFALSEIVNKNHPWLRLQCFEGRTSGGNLKLLADRPEVRKDTFIYTNECSNTYAREGKKPFTKPYKGARVIANMSTTEHVLFSLDENINTKEDFIGKRYMTMRPGMTVEVMHRYLLKDIWKISDKVKVSYGNFGGIKDAVSDGLADIGCLAISTNGEDAWVPVPVLAELMATKKVHFISLNKKEVEGMAKYTGFPLLYMTIPPGSLGPKQTEKITGSGHGLSWWADESMEEEIVYEITKAIYDHVGKFKEYGGAVGRLVTRNNMVRLKLPEELWHKGALKFFKEKGIKVGVR